MSLTVLDTTIDSLETNRVSPCHLHGDCIPYSDLHLYREDRSLNCVYLCTVHEIFLN